MITDLIIPIIAIVVTYLYNKTIKTYNLEHYVEILVNCAEQLAKTEEISDKYDFVLTEVQKMFPNATEENIKILIECFVNKLGGQQC